MSSRETTATDAADGPARGPLYPVRRTYPLLVLTGEPEAPSSEFPTEAEWARAFPASPFFERGRPEPPGQQSTFRMLRRGDRLHLRIDLAEPAGRRPDGRDSVELDITPSSEPRYPYLAIRVTADGRLSARSVARPHVHWNPAPAEPIPTDPIEYRVTRTEVGWRVLLALPMAELGVPPEGFYFNMGRRREAEGSAFAWCDLFGGPTSQVEVFARAEPTEEVTPWRPALVLPAEVAVGLNRLRVEPVASGLSVRVGDELLPLTGKGEFTLLVAERGPVEVELVSEAAGTIATYHADVPRPFLVHAGEPFLPAEARRFTLEVTLNVAGEEALPVRVTCRRPGGPAGEHTLRLTPGRHRLDLPVPPGEADEVTVEAEVALPAGGGERLIRTPGAGADDTLRLRARHRFSVGLTAEEVDRYRPDIRSLPTDRLYWAVIADSAPYFLRRQSGAGAFGGTDREQRSLWQQAYVYALALLYKSPHPENPFAGDPRLLEAAVAGMEFALRPSVSMEEYLHPDNRSLQAYLLTYELLREDIEPERERYWAYELRRRVEGVVRRWLEPLSYRYDLFSADCGTGTNHMAYHIANVYLAGEVFDRADWKELGREFMRRLARHGAEGHFEERRGVPVNHYTWLSANALGEYHRRSRDPEVEPTLRAAVRLLTALTTARGETLSLTDGRASHHRPFWFGDFILSLTPEGRAAARARLLGVMGERPSRMGLELLWRCAENARYFTAGPEENPFGRDDELHFSGGLIVRRAGFHYGLSTVCLGPINGRYRLDPQNVVELFHRRAGCILNGGNSLFQPEAGTFFRPLTDPRWAEQRTAPRADYLPITASPARLADGHDLTLAYWSFRARLALHVLSEAQARLVVVVESASGPEPVVFNFFPGVEREEELEAEAQTLRFRDVTLRAGKPFHLEAPFRIMNPYQLEYNYTHKPVRCWVELAPGETFTLDIQVQPAGGE